MEIYAKIGTHGAIFVRVVRKRKRPVVGESFFVKEPCGRTPWRWIRPFRVHCTEIRDVGQALYFCERI